jgi:YbbR domain-containing protein
MTLWPFRHFALKLWSVGLAVLLWMVVAGEETVERGMRIPLELQQFPAGLELQTEAPSTVDVRVRGGSGALSRLSPVDIVAVLDLRDAQPGQRLFHVTPDQVRVPFGLEIVQITPATIALMFETSASKQVPVVPAIEGRPAPGFVVGRMSADPAMVEIVGPESSVKRAAAALTEPVSVAGARDNVRHTVTVGMLDSTLRLRTSRSAIVDVQIAPAPAERTLRNVAVHLRNLSPLLTAQSSPSTLDVGVRGTREGLVGVGGDDIDAYVDLAGLGVGQYTLTVRADTKREAGVTRIDPAVVRVRIASGQN